MTYAVAFNAYEMTALLDLAASRKAVGDLKDFVRNHAKTVQLPCEFDSRRAENTGSYGLCRTKYGIRATNVLLTCATNRAFLTRTCMHTVLSPCEFKNEGQIVTDRRVCCSCSIHRSRLRAPCELKLSLSHNRPYRTGRTGVYGVSAGKHRLIS